MREEICAKEGNKFIDCKFDNKLIIYDCMGRIMVIF